MRALSGTLTASSNLKLALDNAAAGATSYATLALTPTPAQFANPVGAFQASSPQYLLQDGYSTTAIFTPSALTYKIVSASTSVLKNTLSFDSLTIGPALGLVGVALSSDIRGGFGTATIGALAAEMHAGFSALRQQCPMDLLKTYPAVVLSEDTAKDVARIGAIWQDLRSAHADDGPSLYGRLTVLDAMFLPGRHLLSYSRTALTGTGPDLGEFCAGLTSNAGVDCRCAEGGADRQLIGIYDTPRQQSVP